MVKTFFSWQATAEQWPQAQKLVSTRGLKEDSVGNSAEAVAFPAGHDKHQPYINTYVDLGMSRKNAEEFYYFTINAAPADDMHYMTDAEISQYSLVR